MKTIYVADEIGPLCAAGDKLLFVSASQGEFWLRNTENDEAIPLADPPTYLAVHGDNIFSLGGREAGFLDRKGGLTETYERGGGFRLTAEPRGRYAYFENLLREVVQVDLANRTYRVLIERGGWREDDRRSLVATASERLFVLTEAREALEYDLEGGNLRVTPQPRAAISLVLLGGEPRALHSWGKLAALDGTELFTSELLYGVRHSLDLGEALLVWTQRSQTIELDGTNRHSPPRISCVAPGSGRVVFDEQLEICRHTPFARAQNAVYLVDQRPGRATLVRCGVDELLALVANGAFSPKSRREIKTTSAEPRLSLGSNPAAPAPRDDGEAARAASDLGRSIDELAISKRAQKDLANAGIFTIGDLVQKSYFEILKTKGISRKTADELRGVLAKRGLALGTMPDR